MCMCDPGRDPVLDGRWAAAFIKDIYEQLKCEIDCIVDNVTVPMLNLGVVMEVLCKVGGMCY